jgi:hypothetical protein
MRSRSARTSGPRSWVDIGILLWAGIYQRRGGRFTGIGGGAVSRTAGRARSRPTQAPTAGRASTRSPRPDPREDGQQRRVADVRERVAVDEPLAPAQAALEDVEMQRDRVVRTVAGVGVDGLLRRDRGRHPRLPLREEVVAAPEHELPREGAGGDVSRRNRGSGNFSSRYSRIATDSQTTRSPSSRTGTWPNGFSRRNSGPRLARRGRSTSTSSYGMPFSRSRMRTRRGTIEKGCQWRRSIRSLSRSAPAEARPLQ